MYENNYQKKLKPLNLNHWLRAADWTSYVARTEDGKLQTRSADGGSETKGIE